MAINVIIKLHSGVQQKPLAPNLFLYNNVLDKVIIVMVNITKAIMVNSGIHQNKKITRYKGNYIIWHSLCMLDIFACFCRLLFSSKLTFLKKFRILPECQTA